MIFAGREAGIILLPQRRVWQKIGFTLASLVFYPLPVPWIGYPLSTALFLTILLRVMGKVRWRYGLVFGLLVSAFLYVIFKIWGHSSPDSQPLSPLGDQEKIPATGYQNGDSEITPIPPNQPCFARLRFPP
jgi:Na+/proline symporter